MPRCSSGCNWNEDTFAREGILIITDSGRTNASVPTGMRIYAVGDIHGRPDLLEEILYVIRYDKARRDKAETSLVFLGDYIDRGPDSKGVVTLLINGLPPDIAPVFLKGNHEACCWPSWMSPRPG